MEAFKIDPINISKGLDVIWSSDNIAIVVMAVCLMMAFSLIIYLIKLVVPTRDFYSKMSFVSDFIIKYCIEGKSNDSSKSD